MKFIARKRANGSIISLTPLIDCMFLLVIFIMIVARFDPEGGIPVNLPTARSSGAAKADLIHVTVTDAGKVFLGDNEVPVEDLDRRLVEARTALGDPDGNETVLVVHGDKDALHGKVVEVMDAAARAKQKKVTIRTRGGE